MEGLKASTNGTVCPASTVNLETVFKPSGRKVTGVRSETRSGPGDRGQRIATALYPWDMDAVAKADDQLHPHVDAPFPADDKPDDVGRAVAQRHEID